MSNQKQNSGAFEPMGADAEERGFDEAAFRRRYEETAASRRRADATGGARQPQSPARREADAALRRAEAMRRVSGQRSQTGAGSPNGAGAAAPANRRPPAKRRRKKRHTGLKILLFLLILALLAAVGLGGAALTVAGAYRASSLAPNAYTDESALMHDPAVTNILLMGIDTEDSGASTRSDAMILLSVDTRHRQLKLTSFMRDMYVNVPGYGYTKLTHACMYGGPQLTVDTIELNFGIDIDAYAKIGYDIFRDLAESVGGVTVSEIDATEAAALAIEGVHIEPGKNIHLDGNETLQYCRIRKGQSDFQRTERQREVITLIIKKALVTNPVKLIAAAKRIVSKLECSLDESRLLPLAFSALPCLTGEITQLQVPANGTWSDAYRDSLAVLLVDTDANRQIIYNHIYA